MNVLVVGGAGKVGSIIRPALEDAHTCRYFDRRAVPGAEELTVCGDVRSDAIGTALEGQDAVVYLALGTASEVSGEYERIDANFGTNLLAWYSVLRLGLAKGIRCWVYASSLSVYREPSKQRDEVTLPDAWNAYGMSKRLAENVGSAAVQAYADARVTSLRLIWPRTEAEWTALCQTPRADRKPTDAFGQSPADVRRLFLAALACESPGAHVVEPPPCA